jgi:leader peptidase (prepilin peptidase)/N-methyltransferase
MNYLLFLFVFVFGTIIGSFLNVVALRFKTGKTIKGRSFCFSCGKTLRAHELIPLMSFLMQRGKCRGCKSTISIQYPMVEALTGLVFAFIALNVTSLFWFFLYATAFSILIVIAIYDVRHKIIPDSLAFVFALVGLVAILATYSGNLLTFDALVAFLAGPLLFLPFFVLWFISGGTWMGLGDAKLSIGIGWLLGLATGTSAIILGIWIGAVWSLGALMVSKRNKSKSKALTFKSEIPLAPFLIFGSFLALMLQPDLFSINSWIQLIG